MQGFPQPLLRNIPRTREGLPIGYSESIGLDSWLHPVQWAAALHSVRTLTPTPTEKRPNRASPFYMCQPLDGSPPDSGPVLPHKLQNDDRLPVDFQGMSMTDLVPDVTDDAPFNFKAAFQLMLLSWISYNKFDSVVLRTLLRGGFTSVELVIFDQEFLLLRAPNVAVIVFRGTCDLPDWGVNVGVHSGIFRRSLAYDPDLGAFFRDAVMAVPVTAPAPHTLHDGHSCTDACAIPMMAPWHRSPPSVVARGPRFTAAAGANSASIIPTTVARPAWTSPLVSRSSGGCSTGGVNPRHRKIFDHQRSGDEYPMVHEHLWRRAKSVAPIVCGWIRELPSDMPILLTGASAGGAMAALVGTFASGWAGARISGVYTYGQPRVGSRRWRRLTHASVGHERFFRFMHHKDLVPHSPPANYHVRNVSFTHDSPCIYMNSDLSLAFGDGAEGSHNELCEQRKLPALELNAPSKSVLDHILLPVRHHCISAYLRPLLYIYTATAIAAEASNVHRVPGVWEMATAQAMGRAALTPLQTVVMEGRRPILPLFSPSPAAARAPPGAYPTITPQGLDIDFVAKPETNLRRSRRGILPNAPYGTPGGSVSTRAQPSPVSFIPGTIVGRPLGSHLPPFSITAPCHTPSTYLH